MMNKVAFAGFRGRSPRQKVSYQRAFANW